MFFAITDLFIQEQTLLDDVTTKLISITRVIATTAKGKVSATTALTHEQTMVLVALQRPPGIDRPVPEISLLLLTLLFPHLSTAIMFATSV